MIVVDSSNNRRADAQHLQRILHALHQLDRLLEAAAALVSAGEPRPNDTDPYHGLYISPHDVATLLATPPAATALLGDILAPLDLPATDTRLGQLVVQFGLNALEYGALLLALAPELDLRYERLFGYIQDDTSRRRPTTDLALRLLCTTPEEKLAGLRTFDANAPLLHYALLSLVDDPADPQPALLAKYLKPDQRIVQFLLGADALATRLRPYLRLQPTPASLADLLLEPQLAGRLAALMQHERPPVLFFQGPYGTGKQTLARACCHERGLPLLVLDVAGLLRAEEADFAAALRLIAREVRLQSAALYCDGCDPLFSDERASQLSALLELLAELPLPGFLAGEQSWEPADPPAGLALLRVVLPRPDATMRAELWGRALPEVPATELRPLAETFRLSAGQIRDAAATARGLAAWRAPEGAIPNHEDLYAACRLQSNRRLEQLAHKITPRYSWEDIVLPPDRLEQLREIRDQMRYRALVYDTWGFERKLALGKGLNVLFAGPSGTGKTMAAEIIAGDLGLDLYKIDLSTVVSKYIGETEKNLARIFAEAETSNAVLFFDEADALFGKRSEVRDSHDRYANLEIAYLLQRMEEYAGIVILATNLRKNMDDAFVRRMHATIEFPFPAEADRQRIWQVVLPPELPRDATLDLAFLAQRFEVAGGNIRNIALAAAFLAAADGGVVGMGHLVRAVRREYQKIGKIVSGSEFGEYAHWIDTRSTE